MREKLKSVIGASVLALAFRDMVANLNFRTGSSTSNKVISTIRKGSKIEIISNSTISTYSISDNDLNKIDDRHISIGDITNY